MRNKTVGFLSIGTEMDDTSYNLLGFTTTFTFTTAYFCVDIFNNPGYFSNEEEDTH